MLRILILNVVTLVIVCQACLAFEPPVVVGRFGQEVAEHQSRQQGLPSADVKLVTSESDGTRVVRTAEGWARWHDDVWQTCDPVASVDRSGLPQELEIRQIAKRADVAHAAATDKGLFERLPAGDWQQLHVADGLGRRWATADVRGVTYDRDGRLWFATPAGVGCREPDGWQFYSGSDGLPYNDFTCCAAGADGSVWFGTRRGAIRFLDGRWAYRQGQRWLPNDDVRSILVEPDGSAWLATAGGIGYIARRPMTLAEKAAFYEEQIDQLIKRTPFGYVNMSTLPQPGDLSTTEPQDSDNDGLWTAMYGASQCYAYAVTKSPASKMRARQAFEALRFLQTVTQGGQHSPPPGYVARTILPITGHNPNDGRLARDRQTRAESDRLWKVYEPRWPVSADGRWYWKSDTSSDELDGHYFFYPLYYDLVADNEEEKARVRKVVGDLTDHLIDHHFTLVDHDGTPTRWGYFDPPSLNHDFNWINERGLNSLSMLSYLTVAHHVCGHNRYREAIDRLMQDHSYHTNANVPKLQRGIGSGNQSDDEMAFMSFYSLLKYAPAGEVRQHHLAAFYSYWTIEQPERNPFFHFAYAVHGRGESIRNPFAEHDLSPWGDWLADSIETLKGFPLDRVNWSHSNSHRLDLVKLPTQQSVDLLELNSGTRGYRVDGKVLPVEERFFSHWNTDPWTFDYPGNGRVLTCGSVYLLPYYMGRYYGLIAEPDE